MTLRLHRRTLLAGAGLSVVAGGLSVAGRRPASATTTSVGAAVPATAARRHRGSTSGVWQLSTGSHLAYEHAAAVGRSRGTVVFLHGGPGMPEPLSNYPPVHRLGYDTYAYQQLGSGASLRLDDPSRYTVARNAEDLEAVRAHLGVDRLLLVGHSAGAMLAVAYLHRHPGRVAGFVALGPGPMWSPAYPEGVNDPAALDRLTSADRERYLAAEQDRQTRLPAAVYEALPLLPTDPVRAKQLLPDDVIDPVVADLLRPPTLFRHDIDDPVPLLRPGFWATQVALADFERQPDPRAALRDVRVPTLVLRGTSDYVRREISSEYRDVLGARVLSVHHAGHYVHLDARREVTAAVGAFLAGAAAPRRAR